MQGGMVVRSMLQQFQRDGPVIFGLLAGWNLLLLGQVRVGVGAF